MTQASPSPQSFESESRVPHTIQNSPWVDARGGPLGFIPWSEHCRNFPVRKERPPHATTRSSSSAKTRRHEVSRRAPTFGTVGLLCQRPQGQEHSKKHPDAVSQSRFSTTQPRDTSTESDAHDNDTSFKMCLFPQIVTLAHCLGKKDVCNGQWRDTGP